MKTQINPLGRTRAFTYLTVVVTMIVVGLMLAAYLKLVAVQNQMTMRSQTWNRSVPVIEAGIEEAMAHLNKNGAPDAAGSFNLSNLGVDGWTGSSASGWTKNGAINNEYYVVQISPWSGGSASNFPFITSTGYVQQVPAFALNRVAGPFLAASILDDLVNQGKYARRVVQCTTTNVPTFTKALVAKRGITMSGQNVRTDSFDSGDPAYNDGSGHYPIGTSKWKANGDIASNDTITNAVAIGNANIYGKVATGPYGTVNVGSSGMVGDKTWQSNPANVGKIQPGWSTDDMNMDFPSVKVPSDLLGATPPTGNSTTINGVTYNMVLNNGDYRLPSGQDLNGKIYVQGNVRLLVTDNSKIALSGSQDRITLAPGATLKLYADCVSSSIGGNGVQNDGIASQFYYFGTDKNTTLSYGGNAAFTGVFYAPNADMTLGGGGSTQIDFSGSAIAKTIKLNGNFSFHYDENLKRVGLYRGYVITSWNER